MARTKRIHLKVILSVKAMEGGGRATSYEGAAACGKYPERVSVYPNWVTCKGCRAWYEALAPVKKVRLNRLVKKYQDLESLTDFIRSIPGSGPPKLSKQDIREMAERIALDK